MYMVVIYMLLVTKLKLKEKWHLAHRLVLLLAMKQRINRRFGMVPKFLLEKTSFFISQSFDIKTGPDQNQWKKI